MIIARSFFQALLLLQQNPRKPRLRWKSHKHLQHFCLYMDCNWRQLQLRKEFAVMFIHCWWLKYIFWATKALNLLLWFGNPWHRSSHRFIVRAHITPYTDLILGFIDSLGTLKVPPFIGSYKTFCFRDKSKSKSDQVLCCFRALGLYKFHSISIWITPPLW